ncbi:GMC oxidoreductase [Colletotrichum incanum]|nr:GMC oxidoreductase [Colletotrichum incanum]
MVVLQATTTLVALLLLPATSLGQPAHSNRAYDYIVPGSGPGGGSLACNLARDDHTSNIRTVIANRGYVHHTDEDTELRNNRLTWRFANGLYWFGNAARAPEGAGLLGVYHPHGATIGGSSVTNAMATCHKNMRRFFERIEMNNYLPKSTPGHGFHGYFETVLGNGSQYLSNPNVMDILKSHVRSIGQDPEKLIEMLEKKSISRPLILETLAAKNADGSPKYPLNFLSYSLVTELLFEEKNSGRPKAIGVEHLLSGPSNSHKILQLSGIGKKPDLEAVGTRVVVDLPGVGRNLQGNQEFLIVGHAQFNLTANPNPNEPTRAKSTPGDPCEELWRQGKGPYMRPGYNLNALPLRSNFLLDGERDICIFSWSNAFHGFWPAGKRPELVDPAKPIGFSVVKMHPQNTAEYIKLRSAEPTEPPGIKFELYKEGAETGPRSDGRCGNADPESDKKWIRKQTFGHHPTDTCKIGAADDRMVVLASKFRVLGVNGLRLVGASIFSRAPGAFPAVAIFVISQEAPDVILEDFNV